MLLMGLREQEQTVPKACPPHPAGPAQMQALVTQDKHSPGEKWQMTHAELTGDHSQTLRTAGPS